MPYKKRIHAEAVARILSNETGELVGWLYRWNTGETRPMWIATPIEDVTYSYGPTDPDDQK